jgi:hypothetical protein
MWIDDTPADYPADWPVLPDPDLLSFADPKLTREFQQELREVRAARIAAWERVKRARAADQARAAG